MRVALVINASAGSMSTGLTPQAIRDKIRAAVAVVEEADETAPLPERIEAAAAQPGIDAVVVAGGDGTMACAASVLAGRDMPLALLPLGTMNMLAKDLGVPLDLDAAIANIATGRPKPIDVGEVNGHVFAIMSVLGMPTRLARHRETSRGRIDPRGILRWTGGLLRHLGRYPKLTVTGTIGGVERRLRLRMLAVVVDDFVERAGQVLVRDPVDAGRLTLYVSSHLSLWRTLRLAAGFAFGDWRRLPGLQRHAVTELTIDTRRGALRVMNDGEVRLIAPPLHYSIRRRALTVIIPPDGEADR